MRNEGSYDTFKNYIATINLDKKNFLVHSAAFYVLVALT